jgi:hypothetical protein
VDLRLNVIWKRNILRGNRWKLLQVPPRPFVEIVGVEIEHFFVVVSAKRLVHLGVLDNVVIK